MHLARFGACRQFISAAWTGTSPRRGKIALSGRLGIALACLMLLPLAPGQGLAAGHRQGTISVPLPAPDAAIHQEGEGPCLFTGNSLHYLGRTGEPSLPCQSVTVLLPPDAEPGTVTATMTGARFDAVPGQYHIPPVQPPVAGDAGPAAAAAPPGGGAAEERDAGVYAADALFPAEVVVKVDVQVMGRWKMAQVFYAPFVYNPVRGQVCRVSGDTLLVTFQRTSLRGNSGDFDGAGSEAVRKMAVNFADMAGEYGHGALSPNAMGYVIITTEAIRSASASLADFALSKEGRGFTAQVITEEAWGGGVGNVAADRIRSWLQANYAGMAIKYVLLIGDPHPSEGSVPMKICYPRNPSDGYPDAACPTDFYYAELTSDWNTDRDGKYGEYADDFRGKPPRAAEVAVGRIPYYGSIDDLDRILVKMMSYENAPSGTTAWRKKALLPMEPSDQYTPGYHLAEEIKQDVLVPGGWSCHRVYESAYGLLPPPETVPCTVEGVVRAWTGSRFGAIFWWTHGWAEGAADIMEVSRVGALDDEHPGFTFQCSCSNAEPEDSANLAYSLLNNGCIATVGATRISWYWPGQTRFAGSAANSGMTLEYSRRLVADEMYAGDALNDLRLQVAPGCEEMWTNYLTFNLYGCPAIGVATRAGEQLPPSVTTQLASNIGDRQAVLNGALVSPGAASGCQVYFEWGLTEHYGSSTLAQAMGSAGPFADTISGLEPGTTYNFRACASTARGTFRGGNVMFTTAVVPPSVTTVRASDVTVNSAILNGKLTGLGGASSVQVCFEWGTSKAYGSGATPLMTATGPFSVKLIGLKANTTYHFRAIAEGSARALGNDIAFTTLPIVPPTVVTSAATDVGALSGRLNADLQSLGTADMVTACFVWGTTPGGPYTNETTGYPMTHSGAFTFNLTGLTEGTTCYFKPRVVTDAGVVHGATEMSFTTKAAPLVTTGYATGVADRSATLNGSLNSLGTAGTVMVSFEWGTSPGYGAETTPQPFSETVSFSAGLAGLEVDTAYHFRAKVVGDSTAYGNDMTFTTFFKPAIAPAVDTLEAGPVAADSARLNGELTSLGTAGSVTVSFVWGTARGGPYLNEVARALETSTGPFHFDLGGLASGTTFYYQARAVGDGTGYGAEQSFTTGAPAGGMPAIAGLVANNGRPGDDLTVTLSGAHLGGATAISFGAGITINEFRVVSATEITVKLSITGGAEAGKRDVTVATPAGTATRPGAFTVNEAGGAVHLWLYLAAVAGAVAGLGLLATIAVRLTRRRAGHVL